MGGAHPHLLVNHVPLIASTFGVLLLLFAWAKRAERGRLESALLVLMLAGLGSGAAFLTGIAAEGAAKGMAGIDEAMIHQHHAPALAALILSLSTGALSAVCYVVSKRREQRLSGRWFAGVLVAAIVAAGLLAWTSNLGGIIHHPEIR